MLIIILNLIASFYQFLLLPPFFASRRRGLNSVSLLSNESYNEAFSTQTITSIMRGKKGKKLQFRTAANLKLNKTHTVTKVFLIIKYVNSFTN